MLLEILQYVIIFALTFCLSIYIIGYNSKIKAKGIKSVMRSQSTIYNKTKMINPPVPHNKELVSQSIRHLQKHMVKIMIIEDKAYWVKDNMFFTADVRNGYVLPETERRVDTMNMSQSDIDKMIFIIDKLKEAQG